MSDEDTPSETNAAPSVPETASSLMLLSAAASTSKVSKAPIAIDFSAIRATRITAGAMVAPPRARGYITQV